MENVTFIVLAVALGVFAGCEGTDSATRSAPLSASADPSPPPAPVDGEREREAKRAEARKTPVGPKAGEVDWDAAAGFAHVDPGYLKPEERQKLSDVQVPVLVPRDPALLGTALISHNVNWYAAAFEADGIDIHIRGTRNEFETPGAEIPEAAKKAAENYTLTRTHQIVTVSWRSFGVSYSVDVECARPMEDTRCTEDAFALELAEGLAIVGGSR